MTDIIGVTTAAGRGDGSTIVVTWSPVTSVDTCHPVRLPEYADRSIHVSGVFGGSTTKIEGSNNGGVSFAPLADTTDTTIAISTETIKAVLENTDFIKPVVSGGDATQSLTISLLFHLTNPLRQ